jgi:hypothetical protein
MTTLSAKFGADWDTYLQAVVFNSNVSTCESTGYSPYYLMFGRDSALLHEFVLPAADDIAPGSSNIQSMRESMANTLMRAYEHVRTKQLSDAEKSKLRRMGTSYMTNLAFEIGSEEDDKPFEFAMLWEPQQPKTLSLNGGEDLRAPSKWTPKWTGPHKVVAKTMKDGRCNRYVLWHNQRARKENCHINRLHKFVPWSQELPSTSYWLDNKPGFEQGGFAREGELFILPLAAPYNFGVAKVIASSSSGEVEYQWLGNATNNNNGSFLPGWTRTTHPNIYYSETRKHHSHKPYLGNNDVAIKQKDIILHGFTLTEARKLPAAVRRALAEDVRVGGDSDQ